MFSDVLFDNLCAILKSIRRDYAYQSIYPRAEVINMLTSMLTLINFSDGTGPEEMTAARRDELRAEARAQATAWYDARIVLSVSDPEPEMYPTPTPTEPFAMALPEIFNFHVSMSLRSERKVNDWTLDASMTRAINTMISVKGFDEQIRFVSVVVDDETKTAGRITVRLMTGELLMYTWTQADGALVVH